MAVDGMLSMSTARLTISPYEKPLCSFPGSGSGSWRIVQRDNIVMTNQKEVDAGLQNYRGVKELFKKEEVLRQTMHTHQ